MKYFDSKRKEFTELIKKLQIKITGAIEKADGKAEFQIDNWKREKFGFGSTRIIENGKVFEKGGVNISAVSGPLPEALQQSLNEEKSDFFASGISLVLHPQNPYVPSVHANYRYFELYNKDSSEIKDQWFGGGADLTPYYLFKEDAVHFHQIHKTICDLTHPTFYPRFKKACDEYFFNHHRNEARGIGGIFFDHVRANEDTSAQDLYEFAYNAGLGFIDAYIPIVNLRKDINYNQQNRDWQEIRRGRYVEFNLIHDRGTLFGLKTKGRIESIFMSLPPHVQWRYNYIPKPGSKEQQMLDHLKEVDWLNLQNNYTKHEISRNTFKT